MECSPLSDPSHPRLIDLRGEQKPAGPDPKCGRIIGGRLALRKPEAVIAVCLHQTAVIFGASQSAILAAKGDRQLAIHRRALGVHAHVTAFQSGRFVAAYPLSAYVFHGNGSNAMSIGLEIEGLYNGRPGGSDAEPAAETIEAARAAVRWIVEAAAGEGMTIRQVVAHRQFSSSRRADPGWRIWREVALWAETGLGLITVPDLVDRDGRPIPGQWDPRQTEAY